MDNQRSSSETASSISGAQPGGEWAARQAEGFASTASQGLTRASGYIQHAVDLTRDKMAQLRDGPIEQVRGDVVKYTREQPMTALLVAAGAGLLIGMLGLLRRRQPKAEE